MINLTEAPKTQIVNAESPEVQCPFVSENGPECPICGAPPTSVNLDQAGRYGQCDECGEKFPLP